MGRTIIGAPVSEARDRAVDRGITINGLPIVLRPSRGAPDLEAYYEACVIGGLGVVRAGGARRTGSWPPPSGASYFAS